MTKVNNYSYKMKLFVVGSVFMAYFVHVLFANQKGCSLPLHGEFEKKSPILLQDDDTSLIVATNGKINLETRQTIILLCPDPKNSLLNFELNVTYAQCIHRNILRVENQDVRFQELQCKKIVRGAVLKTTKHCGANRGRFYKIGYQFTQKSFVALIDVCYDHKNGVALYSEHLLHGTGIKHASKSNYRPTFSPEGLSASVAGSVAYRQVFQKATFSKLLKSSQLAEKYINKNSYLAHGHLSPDADFLLAAWQYTSYYYINTVPQWQVINGGNWKKIEGMVRKLADSLQETLTIFTGIYDILRLPDVNGNQKEIVLVSGGKLSVPKFIWKIVYFKERKKAIVLISLNNPFAQQEDLVCSNICDEVGWKSSSWMDYDRGFVHCCDYREFANVVETAPKLQVDGVLQGLH